MVDTAADALAALPRADAECIVTTLHLPDHPGGLIWIDEVLRRKPEQTPLLVCSEAGDMQTRVLALRMGADDVLSTPFDADLFTARVEALLRNARARGEAARRALIEGRVDLPPSPPIVIGGLEVRDFEALLHGQKLPLTPTEFRVLALIVRSHPEPVTTIDLIAALWGNGADSVDTRRTLSTHVYRVRRKIGPELRITHRYREGMTHGYKLMPAEIAHP
jgi:DNA-binding response OmpR family regulator